MHKLFVSTPPPPTYGDSCGIARLWCSASMHFLIVPAVPEKCGGYNIGKPPAVRFSVV